MKLVSRALTFSFSGGRWAAARGGSNRLGPDGNLWFTESVADQIGRITPAGVVKEFPVTPGSGVIAICLGADGKMWFTEINSDKIGVIAP